MCRGWEAINQNLTTVMEDLRQLTPDEEPMGQPAEKAKWQRIVHDVLDLHAPLHSCESVLVIPQSVGAGALFIDETMWCLGILDLRPPSDWNPRG